MKNELWQEGNHLGIKYKFIIHKKEKQYSLKLITPVPNTYYYSIINDIGKEIEETHLSKLK